MPVIFRHKGYRFKSGPAQSDSGRLSEVEIRLPFRERVAMIRDYGQALAISRRPNPQLGFGLSLSELSADQPIKGATLGSDIL